MSDFGAVLNYAMELEASMPEGTLEKFAEMRPAAMGPTKKQREELTRAAADAAGGAPPPPPPHDAPTAHRAPDDKRK